MLTSVTAGPYTVRGVSVGGVYTSLAVPELGLVFDAGIAPRSSAAIDTILLSHGHADHIGALPALLGIRALHGKTQAAAGGDAGGDRRRPAGRARGADQAAALAARDRGDRHGARATSSRCAATCSSARSARSTRCRRSRYVLVRRVAKLRPELHGAPRARDRGAQARRRGRSPTSRSASSSRTRPTRWSRCSITRPSCCGRAC